MGQAGQQQGQRWAELGRTGRTPGARTLSASSGRSRPRALVVVVSLIATLGVMAQPHAGSAGAGGSGAGWSVPTSYISKPIVGPTGNVLATPCYSTITGDNAPIPEVKSISRSGDVAWNKVIPGNGFCPPAVSDGAGVTYIDFREAGVNGIKAISPTGTVLWAVPTPGLQPLPQPALGSNGSVYFTLSAGNDSTRILGLSTATGAITLDIFSFGATTTYAYAGGLGVVSNIRRKVEYYTYSGAILHSYDIAFGYLSGSSQGAEGSIYVTGNGLCGQAGSLVKMTPSGVAWVWTDTETPNLCGSVVTASPDGGAIVARYLNTPARTPHFTSISPTGTQRWVRNFTDFPAIPAFPRALVDTNGVVALPHGYSYQCGPTPNDYCIATGVEFVRQESGTAALPTLTVTDASQREFHTYEAAIDDGRVYLSRSGFRNFSLQPSISAFEVPGLGKDFRVSLLPPPSQSDTFKYVALGDSFSAGEGLDHYFSFESSNRCHRSELAYPTLVEQPGLRGTSIQKLAKAGVSGVEWGFQACSGATTEDVLSSDQWGDPLPQLATQRGADVSNVNDLPVDANTDLVTITVGGDDVHFSDVLKFCAFSNDCTSYSYQGQSLASWAAQQLAMLSPKLDAVYQRVHEQAPDARILVLGYPQLLPSSLSEQRCPKLGQKDFFIRGDGAVRHLSIGFSSPEQNWFRSATTQLNDLIASRVDATGFASRVVRPGTITFVRVDALFAGHEVCGAARGGEWVNGPTLSPTSFTQRNYLNSQSFHPNEFGHWAMAALINLKLNPSG